MNAKIQRWPCRFCRTSDAQHLTSQSAINIGKLPTRLRNRWVMHKMYFLMQRSWNMCSMNQRMASHGNQSGSKHGCLQNCFQNSSISAGPDAYYIHKPGKQFLQPTRSFWWSSNSNSNAPYSEAKRWKRLCFQKYRATCMLLVQTCGPSETLWGN